MCKTEKTRDHAEPIVQENVFFHCEFGKPVEGNDQDRDKEMIFAHCVISAHETACQDGDTN
jgi:hypothetical protein